MGGGRDVFGHYSVVALKWLTQVEAIPHWKRSQLCTVAELVRLSLMIVMTTIMIVLKALKVLHSQLRTSQVLVRRSLVQQVEAC